MASSRIRRSLAMLPVSLAATLYACGPTPEVADSFVMRDYLEEMARTVDPGRNRFANTAMVEAMSALAPRPSQREQLLLRLAIAEQVLYSGRLEDAIGLLESLRADLGSYQASVADDERAPSTFEASILDFLGVAHLEVASRDHCRGSVGSAGCLAPVPPRGRHAPASAAVAAIAVYEEMLTNDPDHLGARWLLNLGHMMAGSYPDAVPPRFLIPPAAFASEHDIRSFRDVAPAAGLDEEGHVGGVVVDDFDGDGLLDVMATSWQLRDPIRYHRNRGDGTFERLTGGAGLEGLWGGGNLVQADYDNDGDLDVLVLRGGWLKDGQPNSLLQNQGDGTFRDVTEVAGLLRPLHPTQTAAWADFDLDGDVDLLVGNETFGDFPHPVQLFANRGDGTFEDVGIEAGVATVGVVKGVAWGDYDNDGRPDIYLSRTGAPNVLFWNAGASPGGTWRFEDRTERAGVAEPMDAFPTWFWDYDNDGWEDIFVAGYRTGYGDVAAEYLGLPHDSELPRLYRNRGDGTFEDVTQQVGLDRILFSMGSNFGDLDNDGWLDHYQGTGDPNLQAYMPNRMFRNDGAGGFQDVTTSGGFGLLEKGHGIAFADIDHDGDQDVFVVMGGAYEGDLARNVLFENPGHGHRWLSLRLVGVGSNRSAIGARVVVTIDTPSGERTLYRTVSSGSSFGGNPLRVEVGLGDATSILSVRVMWPGTGAVDELTGLQPDQAYRLLEGSGNAEVVARTSFRLGGPQ